MKRTLKYVGIALLLFLLFAAGFTYITAKSFRVQTWLAGVFAERLSENLGAEVSLRRLELSPFTNVDLHGLLIRDLEGDTLIAARQISLGITRLNLKENRFRFSELKLRRADVRIRQINEAGESNLTFLTQYFSSPDDEEKQKDLTAVELFMKGVVLEDCNFSFVNPYADGFGTEKTVNVDDVEVTRINAAFSQMHIVDDTVRFDAKEFSFREKSGFGLQRLRGAVEINPGAIEIDGMELNTDRSELRGEFALRHGVWSDYRNFTSAVEFDARFDNSRVHFADIAQFAPDVPHSDFALYLTGKVRGPVSNLRGRDLFIIAGERTIFRGSADLFGLPDVDNTFIDLRVTQLSSFYEDLETISSEWRPEGSRSNIPAELGRAGSLYFTGSMTGFYADLVAYGELTTEAGTLVMDVKVKGDSGGSRTRYEGELLARGFQIGHVLEIPDLGSVTAEAFIAAEGKGEIDYVMLEGVVNALEYKGYTYKLLEVDGEITNTRFTGNLLSRDPNIDFSFSGLADFDDRAPVFDFVAEVNNADLTALNLVDLEYPLYFSTSLAISGRGSDLESFSGSAAARNSFICYGDSTRLLKEVILSAAGSEQMRKITLSSDIADFSITGNFSTPDLYDGFHQMAAVVMPSLRTDRDYTFDKPQRYDFSIHYKASNALSSLLVEGLEIAAGTTVYGSFDNSTGVIDVSLRSDSLRYKSVALDNVVLNAVKQGENIFVSLFTSAAEAGGYLLENPDFTLNAFNDLVRLNLSWLNSDRSGSGELALQANVIDFSTFLIDIDTLRVSAKQSVWRMSQPSRIRIDTSGAFVDGLIMANNEQRMSAFGKVGRDIGDELLLTLKSIDLGYADSLGLDLSYSIAGRVDADINIGGVLGEPVVSVQSAVTGFALDDTEVGDLKISSNYRRDERILDIDAALSRRGFAVTEYKGTYDPFSESPLDGTLYLNGFDLDLLNVQGLEEVDNFSGRADGEIAVTGSLTDPKLKGHIDFDRARFRVAYLNVFFEYSDRVRVEEDWFGIDYRPFRDSEGNTGYVVASAFHNGFSDWTYDISADVEDFLVLDTDRTMNDLFYGTARAGGWLQVGGYDGFLEVNIDARTERGTSLKLPLDESSDVTLENFVHFISKEGEKRAARQANLDGVSVRMTLEATPEAEVQLIFDERTGDIMRGRGSGILTLEVSRSGAFEMFGRYEIYEGSYLFTLQNLINKQFRVRRGSTVAWYGDPYEADLDINAVYSLRTQLFPVMIENRERYRTREEVNVVLNLTDKLLRPVINFEIELPQSTEIERSQLASAVSTVQQLNQQVFALLILNRFLPVLPEQEGEAGGGGFAGLGSATTSDFVSTQISNWLSEISNDFEIGLNYRPGDQISNQEIAVALSTQIFNERVLVSGNFGVTSPTEMQYTRGQSGLVGDFLLEYLITEDGKLRLKVFNETNPYEVFDQVGSIYTQGVGLIYQEDFNTVDEFFKKIGTLFKDDKVEKVIPQPREL